MKPMIRQSRGREGGRLVGGALAKEKSESTMEKVEEREKEGRKDELTVRGRVFISCTEMIIAAFSHPYLEPEHLPRGLSLVLKV